MLPHFLTFRLLVPILALALTLGLIGHAAAQNTSAPIQQVLQSQADLIEKSSRRTIEPAIAALRDSDLDAAQLVLEQWLARDMWLRTADGVFVYAEKVDRETLRIYDFATAELVGEAPADDFDQIKPNSGIQALIRSALVKFQLSDPDPATRIAALDSLSRDGNASHLPVLRDSIADEPDADIRARKDRIERLLTITYGASPEARIAAIETVRGDLGVDVRGSLNPILATTRHAATTLPDDDNIARVLRPGEDLSEAEAYDLLVAADLAPARLTNDAQRETLQANIVDGAVGGVPVAALDTQSARDRAYAALVVSGDAQPAATASDVTEAVARHVFYDTYAEANPEVTEATEAAIASIELRVAMSQFIDLSLDALSLASIYFLAAIGLAITFGVMGVINMAHGEFIMMGAYTGYVLSLIHI